LNRCASNDYFSYLCLLNSRNFSQVAREREQEKYDERKKQEEEEAMKDMYRKSEHNYRVQPCSAYLDHF